ncbi:cation channel sperm-associated protein 4 isoform X2 [Crotalus tigris]|uniref:cation channel sperm-associated protein 4 isoform X2 n=1 Tax=Crotalus tigris TaxID=88082 RepID=UPI00192F4931|nr:cation channel sperm-associated protein 4 isoform X2 [Crotalus tigris]
MAHGLFICIPPLLFLQITQGGERIQNSFLFQFCPQQQPSKQSDQYYRKSSLNELETPLISCKDIIRAQDDWDVEEFISKTCMGRFLHHPAFKILLATLVIGNAIVIALRTEPTLEEKYFGLFSAIDTIVLSFLICEVILNWYYGFCLYWKDGWNIINFCIVLYLCIGLIIPLLENETVFRMVRVMRLIQVCSLVSGLARMIQVILQSIPDMANIMILLFAIMLVFSVFGVTLFGTLVPKHFGNLGTALYSLFICVTQDGWINIYNDFEHEGKALEIGGALYFFIFITFGAFIFANLLVAVVTTNLEQSMAAYHEKKQLKTNFPSLGGFAGFDDGTDDDFTASQSEAVHIKEVIQGTPMVHHQELLSFGNLANLNETTCEDLCLVLEAIHENLKEYQMIRDELDQIVQEVRSLKFNVDQEQEIVLRNIRGANISETMIANNTIYAKTGDVLSTLMNLEKSHLLDREYQKGEIKSAAMRALRQSALDESTTGRRQTLPAKFDKQQRNSMPGSYPEKVQIRRTTLPAGMTQRDTLQSNVTESSMDSGQNNEMSAPPPSRASTDQSQRYPDSLLASNPDQKH